MSREGTSDLEALERERRIFRHIEIAVAEMALVVLELQVVAGDHPDCEDAWKSIARISWINAKLAREYVRARDSALFLERVEFLDEEQCSTPEE